MSASRARRGASRARAPTRPARARAFGRAQPVKRVEAEPVEMEKQISHAAESGVVKAREPVDPRRLGSAAPTAT